MLKSIVVTICFWLFLLQSAVAQNDQYPMPVSESKAKLWSVGATLAPIIAGGGLLYASFGFGGDDVGIGLGCAGLLLGPGAGHAYAKQWGHTLQGTATRIAGAGLFLWGATTMTISLGDADSTDTGGPPSELFIAAGSLMFVISTIHDLTTVGRSVDKFNHSHGFSDVLIKPTYFASAKAPGLMLTLSF